MNCKLLVGIAVMGLIALNSYAVVDTITGSRTLAKFVKTMQDEDAVIITSSTTNGGTIKNAQVATNAAIVASKLSGVTTNVTKQTGAVTLGTTAFTNVIEVTGGTVSAVTTVAPILGTVTQVVDGVTNTVSVVVGLTIGYADVATNVAYIRQVQTVGTSVVGGGAVVTNVAVQNTP